MSKPSVPRNPDFEHLRQPPSGLCWWCGAPATTREHKFKRTDLDLMGGDGGVYWMGDPERLHLVRSVRKSDAVRFEKSLCANCNNARSQPFDLAYDKYRDFVLANLDSLWGGRRLDMQAIFGRHWVTEQANLARYFVKHFGCRFVYEGFTPPAQMADFLDGAPVMPDVHMAFVALADEKQLLDSLSVNGGEGTRLGMGGFYCRATPDRSAFTQVITATYISFLGVRFSWTKNLPSLDSSFFPHRSCYINYFDSDESAAFPPVRYDPDMVTDDWLADRGGSTGNT